MAMESNLNEPGSLYDDINSNSFPDFLEPLPVPSSTTFEYVSNSGVLLGGIQGGLGDPFEEIVADSSDQSTQYSQGTLNGVEFQHSLSRIGDGNNVGDDFPDLNEQITSNPDQTALLQTQVPINFNELCIQETFVPGIWNEPTDQQPDIQPELAYLFNRPQTYTQSANGGWYPHDNQDDPSSALAPLPTSTNDESIQTSSPESSPTVEVRHETGNRRERHPRLEGGYKCDLCAKTFDLHRDMARHKRQHSRNHTCDQCPKTFTSKKDRNRHVDCVHEGRRDYICSVCNKSFGRKDNMRRHSFKAHQEDIPQDDGA